jgi:hypothetical protein
MLLQLLDTTHVKLQQLLDFAKDNNLILTIVEEDDTKVYLPGKKLEASELKDLIDDSRKSGKVKLDEAHQTIRKKINDNPLQQ